MCTTARSASRLRTSPGATGTSTRRRSHVGTRISHSPSDETLRLPTQGLGTLARAPPRPIVRQPAPHHQPKPREPPDPGRRGSLLRRRQAVGRRRVRQGTLGRCGAKFDPERLGWEHDQDRSLRGQGKTHR